MTISALGHWLIGPSRMTLGYRTVLDTSFIKWTVHVPVLQVSFRMFILSRVSPIGQKVPDTILLHTNWLYAIQRGRAENQDLFCKINITEDTPV